MSASTQKTKNHHNLLYLQVRQKAFLIACSFLPTCRRMENAKIAVVHDSRAPVCNKGNNMGVAASGVAVSSKQKVSDALKNFLCGGQ